MYSLSRTVACLLLFCFWSCLAAGPATPAASAASSPSEIGSGAKAEVPPAKPTGCEEGRPSLEISAAKVLTGDAPKAPPETVGLAGASPASSESAGVGAQSSIKPTEKTSRANLLVSSSDLEVTVDGSEYDAVVAHKAKCKADIKLFINGIDASAAASLFAQRREGKTVLLSYHVAGGSAAETLWKPLYRRSGLIDEAELKLAFGWTSTGPTGSVKEDALSTMKVAVAPPVREVLAGLVLVVLILTSAVVLVSTDTFRDPPPAWLQTYRLYASLYASGDAATKTKILTQLDPMFNAAAPAIIFRQLALNAVAGDVIAQADADKTAVGLLINGSAALQPTYSLTRLQLGMWFLFAVATGVFLWIIYGELPPITGSLLIILGISVGTTGASIAAQPSTDGSKTTASQGLLTDIVTGMDQNQHVHRYQAVVVNFLLLAVGSYFVWTELAFPTFDNTWLVFLGVSGATFAGGKQVLENKSPTSVSG